MLVIACESWSTMKDIVVQTLSIPKEEEAEFRGCLYQSLQQVSKVSRKSMGRLNQSTM
jgi:hypothetical protein